MNEQRTSDLEVCRYCEGGAAMSPADCPECEGEVMVKYADSIPSKTCDIGAILRFVQQTGFAKRHRFWRALEQRVLDKIEGQFRPAWPDALNLVKNEDWIAAYIAAWPDAAWPVCSTDETSGLQQIQEIARREAMERWGPPLKANAVAAPLADRLAILGYAPGNYSIRCMDCKEIRDNCDKRALRCHRCALAKDAATASGCPTHGMEHFFEGMCIKCGVVPPDSADVQP